MRMDDAIAERIAKLGECHERLRQNDRDPELRRLTGYSLIPVVRHDTRAAFRSIHGVDTVAQQLRDNVDVHATSDVLLDFLRAYVADELDIDPIEDLAFVLADNSSPYLRAIAGARATHALLGPNTFGGVFVLESLGILAYDLLQPWEYVRFFERIRDQLAGLNNVEAGADAAQFGLPGIEYAHNAALFNIATRCHDWAIEQGTTAEETRAALATAWSAISAFEPSAAVEAHYHELLAEYAGVALRAGQAVAVRRAWQAILSADSDADRVLSRHAVIQSSVALVDAARDAAIAVGAVRISQ
ncbi:MAG: hypothetical protein CHACPFDD_02123 [Phycisphaerae bacterium]|nr:hypothetical protein [Phycisphaerae bacterium]